MPVWVVWFLVAALTFDSSWAAPYKPSQDSLSAQICLERPENNGIVNIAAITIVFSNHQRLILVGGQAACIFVAEGEYSFVVYSANPYDPESTDPKAWSSQEISVQVKPGEVATFEVAPKSEGATYVGGWIVKAREPEGNGASDAMGDLFTCG